MRVVGEFRCDICSSTFRYKRNIDAHNDIYHSDSSIPYICHICGKDGFKTKSNLKQHYTNVHPGKTMPRKMKSKMVENVVKEGKIYIIFYIYLYFFLFIYIYIYIFAKYCQHIYKINDIFSIFRRKEEEGQK